MSDTLAGLLQVGLLLAALAVVLPPAGRLHGPRLHQRARHLRVERVVYRVMGVDPERRPALAGATHGRCWRSPRSASSSSTRCQRFQPHLPLSLGFPACRAGPGVQHGGLVRHQHELAVVLRRVDDGPPRADGRAGRAELRLGRGRASRSRSPSSAGFARSRTDRLGNFWVDLVRGVRAHPAAARGRRRARPGRGGRDPELLAGTTTSPPSPVGRRRSPAARSPRRRPSRSSAPTAAASTTPTPRTRSRTRTP